MSVDTSSTVIVDRPGIDRSSTANIVAADPAFEERWAAWCARGLRRDIVVRRRMRIVALLAALALGLAALSVVLTRASL